ncbi:unnamed protein product, partial [Chrysoparadoxa australica]
CLNRRTRAVKNFSTYPLRFVLPQKITSNQRDACDCAWVYMLGYGGGLVCGDGVNLRCHLEAGASAALTTLGSTRVYKRKRGRSVGALGGSRQTLHCVVEKGALVAVLPDPVICFADAEHTQFQEFHLKRGASLVLCDWLSSGRMERGEVWSFNRFESRNALYVDGELVLLDPLLLSDEGASAIDGQSVRKRMQGFHAIGMVIVMGPLLGHLRESL